MISVLLLVIAGVGAYIAHLYHKRWRFKMIKHYVEYYLLGEVLTTRDNGPLDHVLGCGLIKEIEEVGGKVLYHFQGSYSQVEDMIDYRYMQSKDSDLEKVIEEHYKKVLGN